MSIYIYIFENNNNNYNYTKYILMNIIIFRGAGKSGGRQSFNGVGEQEDLRTVVDYLRHIEHPPKKIILIVRIT